MTTEHQLEQGSAPAQIIRPSRLPSILAVLLFLFVAGGGYWAYAFYNAPLQRLALQEAAILGEINASKQKLEALEAQLVDEHKHGTELQKERAAIEAAKIAEANRGVKDTRPIAPFTPAP